MKKLVQMAYDARLNEAVNWSMAGSVLDDAHQNFARAIVDDINKECDNLIGEYFKMQLDTMDFAEKNRFRTAQAAVLKLKEKISNRYE